MKRKGFKRFIWLLVIVGISYGVYWYVTNYWNSNNPLKSYRAISEATARNVASENLYLFESWRENEVKAATKFKDLNDLTTAYMFEVSDFEGRAGYIVISASTRIGPVLDSERTKNTPVNMGYSIMARLAEDTFRRPSDIQSDFIYLGGEDFYVRLILRDGPEFTERYFLLNENYENYEQLEVTLEDLESLQRNYDETINEDAILRWDEYLK